MASRRSPGDGTIFKRADGYWIGGIELTAKDGKRRQKRVASKNRNEVIRKLRELRAMIDAGFDPTSPRTTVATWMDHWLHTIHRPLVSPGTYRSYSSVVRNHINPHIGTKRLDKLAAHDIRTLYAQLQAESTMTAKKAHTVLGLAIARARQEGLLHRNPMDTVDAPRHTKEARGAFDYDQAVHILQTAVSSGDVWAGRWAAGFLTGARQGEVLGLTWDRVNLTDGKLDLSWQLLRQQKIHGCGDKGDKGYPCGKVRPSACPDARWDFPPGFEWIECERSFVWSRPKTFAGRRTVPIIAPLHAILTHLQADAQLGGHNLVFSHPGGAPIAQDQDNKAWTALLVAADVPHAVQHTMRHSTATLLLKAGVDSHVVKSILGHTDIVTTHGYQHVDLELARDALSHLSGLLPAPQGTKVLD